jgi:hypothetical protein
MTKTELEMQDFSYQNIFGWVLVLGGIYVGYRIYKHK